MKHNKAKMITGMLLILAGFGLFALDIGWLATLACIPVCSLGYSLMAMAMDASGGTLHQSLGSFASKNGFLPFGLMFGQLLGLMINPDLTLLGVASQLLSFCLSALAWAAPYYASRYPAGRPLLKFVLEERK